MENSVHYNHKNKQLTIVYTNPVEDNWINDLFDWLGGYDIISAGELGDGVIVMNGLIYQLTKEKRLELYNKGKVTLELENSLIKFIDTNNDSHNEFLRWYSNAKN